MFQLENKRYILCLFPKKISPFYNLSLYQTNIYLQKPIRISLDLTSLTGIKCEPVTASVQRGLIEIWDLPTGAGNWEVGLCYPNKLIALPM